MLQVSRSPPSQPETSPNAPGQEKSENSVLEVLEMKTPPEMLPEQLSHLECGASSQEPVSNQDFGTKISHEDTIHVQDPISCLLLSPGDLCLLSINPPFQDFRSNATQERSIENSMGSSTHSSESRHAEAGVDGFDAFQGGERQRCVDLYPSEGGLFNFGRLIPSSFMRSGSIRNSLQVRMDVIESIQQISTNSPILSFAFGSPRITISVHCLLNRQVRLPFLPRSQRPPTAAAVSSFARQTETRHSGSQNGDAFRGLLRLSSRRVTTLEFYLPSASSNTRLTPLRHLAREHSPCVLHRLRRFGARRHNITLPWPTPVPPRPPLPRTPLIATTSPQHTSPSTLQELAGNMLPAYPTEMASYPLVAEGSRHPACCLREQLRRFLPRGLRQSEIDKLCWYSFSPEVHEEISCVVCMSIMVNAEVVRVLPCNHEFHAACVDKWLRTNRTCPICRRDASAT